MNLDKSVGKTISAASGRLRMFGKIRDQMSQRVACLVFKQTIAPVLEYSGYLYNGLTLSHQRRLQRIQNRCLRVVLKVRLRTNLLKIHKDTNVNFLSIRHDLQLVSLIHKYVHSGNHKPENTGISVKPSLPGRIITRSTNTMELAYPTYKKLGSRRSPIYRGTELWNQLPAHCRLNSCTDGFKLEAVKYISALYMSRWYPGQI